MRPLGAEALQRLLRDFHRDGFVVVPGVLPHAALDAQVERADYQAAQLAAQGKGPDLDCGLPRMAPWVRPEIVVNPVVEQIAGAILGPRTFMRYAGANTRLPTTEEQLAHWQQQQRETGGMLGLHMDSSYPYSWMSEDEAHANGEEWPHRTQRIFVNFGTHTMHPGNGSTEICEPSIWLPAHAPRTVTKIV